MIKKDSLLLFILMAATLCVAFFTLQINWGWIDDVYAQNILSQRIIKEAPADHFILISKPISFLCQKLPNIGWLEIFLVSVSFISIYLLLNYVLNTIKKSHNSITSVGVTYFLFLLFFLEYFLNIHYSKVSLFATSVGVIGFTINLINKKHLSSLGYFLLFITGVLIRPDATLIVVLFFFSVFFIYVVKEKKYKTQFAALVILLISVYTSLFTIKESKCLVTDADHLKRREYVFNLLDCQNIDFRNIEFENKTEEAKFWAFYTWYFYDTSQFNLDYYEKIGGNQALNNIKIKFSIKLTNEINKLKTKHEYTINSLTQLNKIVIFHSLILFLSLYILYKERKINHKQYSIFVCFAFVIFTLSFLLMTIFLKMEERIYGPLATVYLIILIFTIIRVDKKANIYLFTFLFILLLFRIWNLFQISNDKKIELKLENHLYNELKNNYPNHVVLTDVFSYTLFHNQPFKKNKTLQTLPIYSFGEHPFFQFPSYRKAVYDQVCPYQSFPDFFECINQREDVIWIMPDFKIEILENYYQYVYGKNFKFVHLQNQCGLEKIKSSHLNMNYKLVSLK